MNNKEYLIKLIQQHLTSKLSQEQGDLLHTLSDEIANILSIALLHYSHTRIRLLYALAQDNTPEDLLNLSTSELIDLLASSK